MVMSPPGPTPRLYFDNLIRYSRNPLGFLEEMVRQYGDTVFVEMPGYSFYIINDRKSVEEVLRNKDGLFIKDKASHMVSRVVGNGLIISEGDFWKGQRKAAQPAFHPGCIAGWAGHFTEYCRERMGTWHDGQVIVIQDEMMKTTLRIIAKIIFNVDVTKQSAEVGEAMVDVTDYFSSILNFIFPEWLPTPANIKLKRSVRELNRLIVEFGKGDASAGEAAPTMQDMLRSAGLGGDQLRDELVTFLLAGHETTALALSFSIYLLSKHPEALEKLRAEIKQVAGGRPIAVEDYKQLAFTKRVFQEALRLYPPAWSLGREALQDCELSGFSIPAHAQLAITSWLLHRDERYFKDPLVFKPERWESIAEHDLSFAYIPFGAGPRACIGREFAMMEGVLILGTLFQTWNFELVSNTPLEFQPSITLRPKKPLEARVKKF